MSRIVLDHDTGFFSMSHVNDVLACPNLESAKALATEMIDNYPNARDGNIVKARKLVETSRTKQQLAFGMSNFILSFQGLQKI